MSMIIGNIEVEQGAITVSFDVPLGSYRLTKDDYVYYNSDLNKFIGKEIKKEMTSIDLDLLQYKKSRGIIRLAEYKHNGEKLGYQQESVLRELSKAFKFLNEHNYPMKFQCHLIRGNYPYGKIAVTDFITDKTYELDGDNVIQYLMVNPVKL